jgi:hypothetical protein
MKLEIKPEFNDSVITIKHPALGNVVFDTASVEPKDYQHFYDLGFKDYFTPGANGPSGPKPSKFKQKLQEKIDEAKGSTGPQGPTGPLKDLLDYVA